MSQINQLIYQYLDDRESLSDEEMELLVSTLRNRPGLAKQLKDQLIVQELLGQTLAIDRKHFTAQVEQRIRDLHQPMPLGETTEFQHEQEEREEKRHSSPATNVAPQTNADDEEIADSSEIDAFDDEEEEIEGRPEYFEHAHRRIEQWSKGNRKRRFKLWTVIMVCMLAIGSGVGYWSVHYGPHVAIVTALEGEFALTRDSANQVLTVNQTVLEGDELATTRGTAAITYADGTVVTVKPNSRVLFQKRKLDWFPLISGKQVEVLSGMVSATVAPQSSRFPMHFSSTTATAIILGTELSFQVSTDSTRLKVDTGTVELKRKADQSSVIVHDQQVGFASNTRLDVADATWPTETSGLLLLFETGNKLSQTTSHTGETETLQLTPRKDAEIDSEGRLDVRKGSFLVENNAGNLSSLLLNGCQHTNELSIETTFQTSKLQQTGPARLMTFAKDSQHRNFTLCQRDRQMVLRLTTDAGTVWKEIALFEIPDLNRHHLLVSYRSGELVAWLDGKRVYETQQVRGTFAKWEAFSVVVGDDQEENRPWSGILEGIAIYNRFISENEAQENSVRYQQLLNKRQQ